MSHMHRPDDPKRAYNVDDPHLIWGSGYVQQTVEILHRASWRTVLVPILIGIGVVVAFNFFLLAALDATDTRPLTAAKWDILLDLDAPVDWLILGDSTASTGLRPDVIKEMTGADVLNLGTVGNWAMLNDVWMLERYLEEFGAPQGVIIVHALETFERGYPDDAVIAQARRPPSFYDDYSVPLESSRIENAEFYLLHYTPIFSRPDSAKQLFRNLIEDNEQPAGVTPDGFQPIEPNPANVQQDLIRFVTSLEADNDRAFNPSEVNQAAFDTLITLAERYQFTIYMLHGPLYEGVLDEPAAQDYIAQVQRWLAEQDARSARLEYEPTIVPFAAEDMQNIDHISADAAATFTRSVIPAIILAEEASAPTAPVS